MPAAKRKAADDEHERFDLGSGGSRSASPEPAPSKPSTSSSARQQQQPPVKRAKTTTTGGASGSRTNGKARETPIAVTDVEEEPAPTIQPLRRPTADVREIERVRKLLKDRDEQLDAVCLAAWCYRCKATGAYSDSCFTGSCAEGHAAETE